MKTNLKYISILLACAVLSSCSAKAENTEQTATPTVQTTETQVESSAAAKIVPADLTMTDVAGNVISAADFSFVTVPKAYGWTSDSDEYIALENGGIFNGLEIYDASTRYWFWDDPDETLHFIEAKYSLGSAADSFAAFTLNGYIKIDESVWFYPEFADDMEKFPFIHEKGFHDDLAQNEVGTITFEGAEIPVQTIPVCIYSDDKTKEELTEYADGEYHYVALSFENIDFRTGSGGTQSDTDPQIQTLAEGFIRNIKNAEK